MADVPKDIPMAFRIDRLRACMRELWKASDIDLHMCDGSLKAGQSGLLRDIREDVGHLLSERERRTAQGVTVPPLGWVTVRVEDTGDGLVINPDDAKRWHLKHDQHYEGHFLPDGTYRIAIPRAPSLSSGAGGEERG